MKYKLSIPTPKLSHKALVIVGIIAVLALFGYTIVLTQVQHNKQLAREAAIADNNRAVLRNLDKRIDALEAQNNQYAADKQALCSYLKTVQTAKYTRGLVTTPTAGHCN